MEDPTAFTDPQLNQIVQWRATARRGRAQSPPVLPALLASAASEAAAAAYV